MCAVPGISWSRLHLPFGDAIGVIGWIGFWGGIVLYYAAMAVYAVDVREAVRASRRS
jgi:hypothetical protein